MDAISAAFLTELSHELASVLTTTYFIEEIALADLDDDDGEFSAWKVEVEFVLEHLCYKEPSLTGQTRYWFSDERLCELIEDEANWGIIGRVMHFFNEHDIRVE